MKKAARRRPFKAVRIKLARGEPSSERVTHAHGGTFELVVDSGNPVVINDTALTRRSLPSLQRAVGTASVREMQPQSVSEDFALFANVVPGFFYRLGVADPRIGSGPHHSPTFRADDASIPVGIRTMSAVVLDYLGVR